MTAVFPRSTGENLTVAVLLVLSILCALLMSKLLDAFLPRRRGRLARLAMLAVLTIASSGPFWIGDGNALYLLPFFFAAFLLCMQGPVTARLVLAAILYPLYISVGMLVDSMHLSQWYGYLPNVLKLLLWAAILWTVRRMTSKDGPVELPVRLWGLVGMLALAPLGTQLAFVLGLTGGWYELADQTTAVVSRLAYLSLPFAALSDLALLYALILLSRYVRMEGERRLTELSRTYYAQLEDRQQALRCLRHDMVNHLEAMSALPPEERDAYLAGLLKSPALQPGRAYSENRVVNVVLTAKTARAEEDGTALDVQVSVPAELPVAPEDLCALLANALDNALEACRELPPHRRRVTLRLRADQGMLVLRLENPCAGSPKREGRRLLSTKPNPTDHGLGTESIRAIAGKYGGDARFTVGDETFELLLYLPLP